MAIAPEELARFYEEINEHDEPGIEEAMRRSIDFLKTAVSAVPEDGVVMLSVS